MWDLPRPGLEPMSSALAGRFLTTAPPGKSLDAPPPPLFKNIAQALLPSVPWIFISLPTCSCFSCLEWKKKKKPQTLFRCYFPFSFNHISLFYFTAEFFFKKRPCSLTPLSLFSLSLEHNAVRLHHSTKAALSKVTTVFQWPFLILQEVKE